MDNNGYLELIYGPMFSGKTTKLLKLYNEKIQEYGCEKCLLINYEFDKRYSSENKVITHNGESAECICVINLNDFIDNPNTQKLIVKSKYIFINEAQFFDNLLYLILFFKNVLKKHIVLCGLDLDYKKEKFGELMDLIPYANKINKLTGKCNTDECCFPSEFTHRIIEFDNQILIGTNSYVSLCDKCYKDANN